MFHPSEVEMGTTTQMILSAIEAKKPTRVVIDSLSELQLLADTPLRYRRQVLALKQFFARRSCTVVLLDDRTAAGIDLQVRSIAHGVITLDQSVKDYGAERRRVRVVKYRGIAFRGGLHGLVIRQLADADQGEHSDQGADDVDRHLVESASHGSFREVLERRRGQMQACQKL